MGYANTQGVIQYFHLNFHNLKSQFQNPPFSRSSWDVHVLTKQTGRRVSFSATVATTKDNKVIQRRSAPFVFLDVSEFVVVLSFYLFPLDRAPFTL